MDDRSNVAAISGAASMLPDEALRELFIQTDEDDDRMWVPRGDGVWSRPLMFNVSQGSWVNITRAEGDAIISRHRHPAAVTGFTLEGSWGYLEHDWTARAGNFLFEPPGETHTLITKPPENRMLVLFHNFGPLIMVDEHGETTGYVDVFTRIQACKAHYDSVGLGADFVDRMIR